MLRFFVVVLSSRVLGDMCSSVPSDVPLQQSSEPMWTLRSAPRDLDTRHSSWPKLLRIIYRLCISGIRPARNALSHAVILLPGYIQRSRRLKTIQSHVFPNEIWAITRQCPSQEVPGTDRYALSVLILTRMDLFVFERKTSSSLPSRSDEESHHFIHTRC